MENDNMYSAQINPSFFIKSLFNPFKPEFTIVIFINYKPWIAVAIPDL